MSAEAQIKSFIERIIRLKDEQDAIGEDIKAVYAEAKSLGFDKTGLGDVVTHLRKIEKKGADTIAEKEAIFDIYLSAYQGPQARASARTRENIEEFDAETGELSPKLAHTIVAGMQTEAGRAALVAAVDIMIDREEANERNTPETAKESPRKAAGAETERPAFNPVANVEEEFADESAASSVDPASRTDDVRERQHASTVGFADDCRTGGKEQVAAAPVPVGEADARSLPANSPETADDVTRPAALAVPGGEPSIPSPDDGGAKMDGGSNRYPGRSDETVGIDNAQSGQAVTTPKPAPSMDELRITNALILRPNCKRPGQETCGGQGRTHCRDCTAAPVEKVREEA